MCKCCEKIKFWKEHKLKNDKLFAKIAVYGWREGERRIKGHQSFDYTTKPYDLNYCPECRKKVITKEKLWNYAKLVQKENVEAE